MSSLVNQRESNFELLRLILMFLIVVHHGIVHGLMLSGMSPNVDENILIPEQLLPLFIFINVLCIPSVNVFVLISGYFGIKASVKGALKLLLSLLFYVIIFSTAYYAINGNMLASLNSLLLISHSPYWFITDYFFLMCIAPILNMYVDNSDQRSQMCTIVLLIVISCYFGFIWLNPINSNGYTLFQFIMMYLVGRYIGKFYRNKSINRRFLLFAFLFCSLSLSLIMFLLYRIGRADFAWGLTHYNNPIIIAQAIMIFLLFKSYSYKNNTINKIASSSLAVYLVQSSPSISELYYRLVSKTASQFINMYNDAVVVGGGIVLTITLLPLLVMMFSLAIDMLQKKVNSSVINMLLKIQLKLGIYGK